MPRVVHFEIHAEDPERAAKFYADVLGWEIKKWEFPKDAGDVPGYWIVMTGKKEEPGINGGILKRHGAPPQKGQAVNAYVCTVEVDNLDAYMKKAENAGGTLALPKQDIPSVGELAYMIDTEGNIFGMLQPAKPAS